MPEKPSQDRLRVPVESLIITLRGDRVILDSNLARIYGVRTGALNRAVKRNLRRFPEDFIFQLTVEETIPLRCQSGISKGETGAGLMKTGRGGRRYLPYAFTEHGAKTGRPGARVESAPGRARIGHRRNSPACDGGSRPSGVARAPAQAADRLRRRGGGAALSGTAACRARTIASCAASRQVI